MQRHRSPPPDLKAALRRVGPQRFRVDGREPSRDIAARPGALLASSPRLPPLGRAQRQGGECVGAMEEQVRLPQTEAIMEAIIRSSKPLPIGGGDDAGSAFASLQMPLRRLADRLVPLFYSRWVVFFVLLAALVARIAMIQRHFFTVYIVAIYILNQALLFVSLATDDEDSPSRPASDASGEYRPFVRALSEFRLCCRGVFAFAGALAVSFVDDFDLDVDVQFLLCFFVVLFGYTMKQQISHMAKHGYVPWNFSKKKASGSRKKGKQEDMYDV